MKKNIFMNNGWRRSLLPFWEKVHFAFVRNADEGKLERRRRPSPLSACWQTSPLPERERGATAAFTLIELLISIGIFSVFLVIISGVFSRFVEVQRHSIEQGTLILEVQSAVETFIKEARTAYGSTYRSDGNGTKVSFNNQAGVCVSYQLRNGSLERAEDPSNPGGTCDSGDFTDPEYAPLTSEGIEVTEVFFDANPSFYDPIDFTLSSQGVITLVLTAKSSKSQGDIPPLTVQNTVTSRQVRAYEP